LGHAVADPPPNGTPAPDTPPTITIEAQRQRGQLRAEINQFVQATIVSPDSADSLLRWDSPVCPLVAGLTREQGEFVLGRLSAIARDANVPLAGEHCAANLFVIVAPNPSRFLSLWWDHDWGMFNTDHGIGGVKHFIEADSPVRVWYNYIVSAGGGSWSRLKYVNVRAIASVIMVIDAQKLAKLNFGQLADYVSMRSLAEIKPDTDAGGAPSILRLFSEQDRSPPQGLTAWDQALLHAVYSTNQKDRMQLSEIETATFNQLVAVPAH